jgi:DNA-binding response OmpR family regulator
VTEDRDEVLIVGCLTFDGARYLKGPSGRARVPSYGARILRTLMATPGETVGIERLLKLCPTLSEDGVRKRISRLRRRIEHVGGEGWMLRSDRGRGYALGTRTHVTRTFSSHQINILNDLLATHPDQSAAAVIRSVL